MQWMVLREDLEMKSMKEWDKIHTLAMEKIENARQSGEKLTSEKLIEIYEKIIKEEISKEEKNEDGPDGTRICILNGMRFILDDDITAPEILMLNTGATITNNHIMLYAFRVLYDTVKNQLAIDSVLIHDKIDMLKFQIQYNTILLWEKIRGLGDKMAAGVDSYISTIKDFIYKFVNEYKKTGNKDFVLSDAEMARLTVRVLVLQDWSATWLATESSTDQSS